MDSSPGSCRNISDAISSDLPCDPDTTTISSEVLSSNILSRDPAPTTLSSDAIDLGEMITAACGSLYDLRKLREGIDDTQRFQYPTHHTASVFFWYTSLPSSY